MLLDGTLVKNVEVFHRIYEILGWVGSMLQLPYQLSVLLPISLYGIWASWRLFLTGRPDLATIVRERSSRLACKTQSRCRLMDEDD
ncbi:MAG: hypothetical protein ACYTXI_40005 [Nostoc sp.]